MGSSHVADEFTVAYRSKRCGFSLIGPVGSGIFRQNIGLRKRISTERRQYGRATAYRLSSRSYSLAGLESTSHYLVRRWSNPQFLDAWNRLFTSHVGHNEKFCCSKQISRRP